MIPTILSRLSQKDKDVNRTDADTIVNTIGRNGWQAIRITDGWWISRPDSDLVMYLSVTPSWLCLQTLLDTVLSLDALGAEQRARVYRYLLSCNEAMFMTKFSLDSAGRFMLGVELPLQGSLHRIDDALAAIMHCWTHYVPALAEVDVLEPIPIDDRAAKERFFEQPPGIPAEVAAYYVRAVEPRGWGIRSKPRGVTWPMVYKGQRLFKAYLTITRTWVYFHVPALLETPFDRAHFDLATELMFLEYLLSANDVWYMAKLGLDEAGQVLVTLEVPTPDLDFETFRGVAHLLATYLDLYAREIQIMAHLPSDPKLAERLVSR